jgi:predicted CXXCH cytochrome family protein
MVMRSRAIILLVIVILVSSLAIACSSGEGEPAAVEPTPEPLTPTPDQSSYWTAWQSGPHADTYDLESGPNTYCAKCHSPENWDRYATIDPPPNCVSCKFPSEAHVRVAEGNPLVPEEEWTSITCSVCHRVENGIAESEFAWHDNITGYYETVSSATELCEKCHLDSETLNHERDLGTGAHADYECTECHDAHSASASCEECHVVSMVSRGRAVPEHATVTSNKDCDECHAGAFSAHPIVIQEGGNDDCFDCHGFLMGNATPEAVQMGHNQVHTQVSCVACHDASGMEVGPLESPDSDEAIWVTFRTTAGPLGETKEPYQSHFLQRSVACTRCHP